LISKQPSYRSNSPCTLNADQMRRIHFFGQPNIRSNQITPSEIVAMHAKAMIGIHERVDAEYVTAATPSRQTPPERPDRLICFRNISFSRRGISSFLAATGSVARLS
jgi:hypothetical protein